jgi:hypothetical protein
MKLTRWRYPVSFLVADEYRECQAFLCETPSSDQRKVESALLNRLRRLADKPHVVESPQYPQNVIAEPAAVPRLFPSADSQGTGGRTGAPALIGPHCLPRRKPLHVLNRVHLGRRFVVADAGDPCEA